MQSGTKKISAFQLAMLTVAYVASIRAMPTIAEYGFSSLFYYILAVLFFLIPSALISAELAAAWPGRGGIYVWVKEALGGPWGFLAIWLQFLTNIFNFPAFLSFLAATFAYIFMPQLANNKFFLVIFILTVFWFATLISFRGMQISSWVSTFGYIVGVLIPLITIIIVGIIWLVSGNPAQIHFTTKTFFPNWHSLHMGNLAFLALLLYSFTGMEVSGAHALDVKDVKKNYPRGIFIASILICFMALGPLAIAVIIPAKQLSLLAGIMQAYSACFTYLHLSWATSIIAFLIVIGSICTLNASIIGPSKGLFGSATGGEIPPFLTKLNKQNMPINMFLFQGIVVTIFSLCFLLLPYVNDAYWLIVAVVSSVYLCMYVLLFISAIVLRYKQPDVERPYKVPGGKFGMWLLAILGLISVTFGLFISFIPPEQLPFKSVITYEILLVTGVVAALGLGFIIYICRRPHWQLKEKQLTS